MAVWLRCVLHVFCMCGVWCAVSADMLFCQDNRDTLRAQQRDIKPHDMARKFGEMWKGVADDVREVSRAPLRPSLPPPLPPLLLCRADR